MKIGLIIIVVSIIWYVLHAAIYNHYLQKNNPGLFEEAQIPHSSKRKRKGVQVVVTNEQTPPWLMLLGMPPIPLFFLGILTTIVGFIISIFR